MINAYRVTVTNRSIVGALICFLLVSHLGVFGLIDWKAVLCTESYIFVIFAVFYIDKRYARIEDVHNFPDGHSEALDGVDEVSGKPIREQIFYRTIVIEPNGFVNQEEGKCSDQPQN